MQGLQREEKACNLEVGHVVQQQFAYSLVILAESWPDWTLALNQSWANVFIFCDCIYRTEIKEKLEELMTTPFTWQRLLDFESHECRRDPNLVTLISGSFRFLSGVEAWIPEAAVLIAVAPDVRHRFRPPLQKRLHWDVVRHESVGGVTSMRCGVGIPVSWDPVLYRPHVRRTVKHVLIYSIRAAVLRAGDSTAGLSDLENLLDVHHLDQRFRMPVRTRLGEVPGVRALAPAEIGAAFDLPLSFASMLEQYGLDHPCTRACLLGTPSKVLQEVMHHVVRRLSEPCGLSVGLPAAPVPRPVSSSVSSRETPAAERDLPPWARVCIENAKAAKADEAKPNVPMWDLRVQKVRPDLTPSFLERFRAMLMPGWRRRCYLSFRRHMSLCHGADWLARLLLLRRQRLSSRGTAKKDADCALLQDGDRGAAVLTQNFGGPDCVDGGSFWDWDGGSALFFWRWPSGVLRDTRDGTPMWVSGDLPRYRAAQRAPRDPTQAALLQKKIWKVRARGYIEPGPVLSLTNVFAVPKVTDPDSGEVLDIRAVYDATKSELNAAVWAPSFWMPTVESLVRMLDFDSWLGDVDIGEMFLNFPLDPRIRPFAGVDLTALAPAEDLADKRVLWERWSRMLMGFKPSPYVAIRLQMWGEEIVRGDRRDPSNVFRWDYVRLNLPTAEGYDPALPWVSKVFRDTTGLETILRLACDFVTFVDDLRAAGYSLEAVWRVLRRIASVLNYLGIQDAPRKRRSPLKTEAGAWTGALQKIYDDVIVVLTSQQKWDKARKIVARLREKVESGLRLHHHTLLKERGFLVHLTMTYPILIPYLKGLHLTVDSWRPGRNDEGWRMAQAAFDAARAARGDELDDVIPVEPNAPDFVTPVPRLLRDLGSLSRLLSSPVPAERVVRAKTIIWVMYGFGDASGSGFGSSTIRLRALGRLRKLSEPMNVGNHGLRYRIGVWGKEVESASSNYRELRNIVETVEDAEEEGHLADAQLFMCTDNGVTEAAIYKGTSSDPELYELVLRLKMVEMRTGCTILVSHVSGKRMIAQGTDGISRGNLAEGVMAGRPMIDYLPFHLSAIARSPPLLDWIRGWIGEEVELLEPDDWFEKGHDIVGGSKNCDGMWIPSLKSGTYLWAPPPAAADAALEELRKARHKRQSSTHVVVIPRLMTPRWRKQLHKAADLVLFVPPTLANVWPVEMFEPCLIGIVFPFIPHRPWQLRGVPRLLALEREVRSLWDAGDAPVSFVLRKFVDKSRQFPSMPGHVVRRLLSV